MIERAFWFWFGFGAWFAVGCAVARLIVSVAQIEVERRREVRTANIPPSKHAMWVDLKYRR